jgi:succinylglutamate desuccinylase
MQIRTVGTGKPEVAVVGAVHGDEPCGADAIRRFLSTDPALERPTAFVIANERALDRGDRYVDVDLNRVLPGDPNAEEHERRLAARLVEETEGRVTLGIHSTRSYDGRFGVLSDPTDRKRAVFERMSLTRVADTSLVSGSRCVDQPMFVDVEVGPQGSDRATRLALATIHSFLRAVGALAGPTPTTPIDYYRVTDTMEKDPGATYEFLAENFERVDPGDVYARKDGTPIAAEDPFWPVLASGDGHDVILGYRSQLETER